MQRVRVIEEEVPAWGYRGFNAQGMVWPRYADDRD